MADTDLSETTPGETSGMFEVTSGVNGSVFGPADRRTLDQWLQEDRITPDCQIREVGTDLWLAAESFFPQLNPDGLSGDAEVSGDSEIVSPEIADAVSPQVADPFAQFKSDQRGGDEAVVASTSVNPYVAGSTARRQIGFSDVIVPTSGDLVFILRRAFEVYITNFGVMVGGVVLSFVASFFLFIALLIAGAVLGEAGELLVLILSIFLFTYLVAGLFQLALNVSRGQLASVGDCFCALGRVLPLMGCGALTCALSLIPLSLIAVLIAFARLTAIDNAEGVIAVGSISLLMVALFCLLAMTCLWPSFFLVLDRKTTVLQAFPVGFSIARKNIIQFTAVLIIVWFVAGIGFMGFGIGIVLTLPKCILILTCAYLNMSGQMFP